MYVACLTFIGAALTSLATQTLRVNTYAQVTGDLISNARGAVDTMAQEVRFGASIYTPTSRLGTTAPTLGQLSLETTRNLPTGESTTYVDFYVDAGRLYRKRENGAAEILTSERVTVQNLSFTSLNASSRSPAVRMSITLVPQGTVVSVGPQPSVTLMTTAALRTN